MKYALTLAAILLGSSAYGGGLAEPIYEKPVLECKIPIYGKDGVTILYYNLSTDKACRDDEHGGSSGFTAPSNPGDGDGDGDGDPGNSGDHNNGENSEHSGEGNSGGHGRN